MFNRPHDARVRSAAFEWLTSQVALHGEVLPRPVLARGFGFEGARVPLLGPGMGSRSPHPGRSSASPSQAG